MSKKETLQKLSVADYFSCSQEFLKRCYKAFIDELHSENYNADKAVILYIMLRIAIDTKMDDFEKQ